MGSDSKVVWNLVLQWYGTQFYSSMGSDSLNSRSFARAWRTREAPMRLERAADSVAANTPTVMRGGTTLMSYGGRRRGEGKSQYIHVHFVSQWKADYNWPEGSCSCSAAVLLSRWRKKKWLVKVRRQKGKVKSGNETWWFGNDHVVWEWDQRSESGTK